jgi:hypothetical protein
VLTMRVTHSVSFSFVSTWGFAGVRVGFLVIQVCQSRV